MAIFSRLFKSDERGWSDTHATTDTFDSFDVGDRAGAPLQRPRSKALRGSVLALALLGIGAATYHDPSLWPKAWSTLAPAGTWLIEAASSPQKPQSVKAPEPPSANTQTLAPVPMTPPDRETRETAPAARIAIAPTPDPEKPLPPADTRSPEAAKRDAAISAMRQPITDPHQKRAEAAGLHPDISVALLKRLTEADYKAAAAAIRKALAELGEDGALVWPEKRKPTAALFRVSFVTGAAPDCRRYIVAIAKDGWQTTALPVETCGIERAAAKKGIEGRIERSERQ